MKAKSLVLTILICLIFAAGRDRYGGPPEPDAQKGLTGPETLEVTISKEEEIHRFIQNFHTGLSPEEERELAKVIVREAQRYDCPPELVLAIIVVESSFRHRAVSSKGAVGLMQLRPFVAKAMAREMGIPLEAGRVFDPELNVKLGLFYLSRLLLRFGDLEVALVAYNYGPTYVARRLKAGKPLPRTYVRRVLRHYHRMTSEGRVGRATDA